MMRKMPIAIAACIGLASLGTPAADKPTLKSVSVDLPAGDRTFPAGPGADVANDNCLACHSAGMVLNQPALPKSVWEAEVDKMREAYKAPIDAKDVGAIVGYLVSIKGAN
jgi:mono/diheme cytochrome c family protein